MKKLISVLCAALLLAVPALSLAADLTDCAIANAVVTAPNFVDLCAPFSGTLCSFDLESGDTVSADQELMRMMTTTVYAPETGVVSAVFAAQGDDAAAVCQRYGALVTIEPEHMLQLACSTSGAYNDAKNRLIHLGETVYARSDSNRDKKGEGRVVAVNGSEYVVELVSGNIELSSTALTVYRDDDYETKSNIGKGFAARRSDALVQAAGRVMTLLVSPGDKVTAGMPVAELMTADAAPDAVPVLTAPAAGVVAAVAVSAGQQVWKGQLLARIYLTDTLEVTAQVDEMDLGSLAVGDRVTVTLDTDESRQLDGTVTEIAGMGVTKSNAAYFAVRVAIPAGSARLGSSASVYLPRR